MTQGAALQVVICVGSSCHVHGADEVAAILERLLAQEGLEAQVELIGAFCMDRCSPGVSVRVGEEIFRVRPEDAETFFRREILPRLRPAEQG